MPACANCHETFTIYPEDTAVYQKFGVPAPTWCPPCREMRRLAWRNTRVLYSRTCDRCQKMVISMYPADAPYTIYCPECWWADDWDGREYARDFDFSRPFFPQFTELMQQAPRISNLMRNSVNCDYSNAVVESKNCYLVFSSRAEDCCYGWRIIDARDSLDCLRLHQSELCSECVDCYRCFNVHYSRLAFDCHDSAFLYDCTNCHDCFLCIHQKNKQYCYANQQLTPEQYAKKIADFKRGSWQAVTAARTQYQQMVQNAIHRFAEIKNSENCIGDNLYACKNCFWAFDVTNGSNHRYFGESSVNTTDCMDSNIGSLDNQLMLETISIIAGYQMAFDTFCWSCTFTEYSDHCLAGGTNYFGCVGLKKGHYAILNREYGESEYTVLRKKIIAHMRETGEWGEFFPIERSPFAYNETQAADYFPLSREQVLQKGWRWADHAPGVFGQETLSAADLPDAIADAPDTITREIIACAECKKNYKIIPQELAFYRHQHLPLPRSCPDCRLTARVRQGNPHRLWERQCLCTLPGHGHSGQCSVHFQTSFAADRAEKVYCEGCYNKEIY